jgi:exodeoxyribonuclease III
MRIINFSADGIKAAEKNGFFEWIKTQDADFICIQDLRAQEYDLGNAFFPEGYYAYFFDTADRSNGVAIYTRKLPKAIMTGLGFNEFDQEARFIQADFDEISIGSILVPRSTADDPVSMERKAHFLTLLQAHFEKIRNKRREFVFAGNWNIAHNANDTQQHINDNEPGFLLSERRWLDEVTHQSGYIDAFREVNTDNDEFTWWPDEQRANGQRIDFQLVSTGLKSLIEYGTIYKKQVFSSHAPVIMDYDFHFEDDPI